VPSIPNLQEPLSDGAVALRFSTERDIPEILIAYEDDRALHKRLGLDRPPSGAELGRRAERAELERAAGNHVAMTILEPGSDACRGQIYTPRVDWNHARAEIGMWLAPQVRGRGLAPRALRLAAGWLVGGCGLERLQILTEPDNEPMLATARGAGFVDEGVLRAYMREGGARVDCAILSLLPSGPS
jgi:[ribosomal protein S5]-alanine N-acetyltransferase